MLTSDKSSQSFFENKYVQDPDPWNFAADASEQARYATIIDSLGCNSFGLCVEPGCSVGALTERLATRCDFVEASDFSPTAAATAKRRCVRLLNVRIACATFPDEVKIAPADLVILSEIGYYFSLATWQRIVAGTIARMKSGSTLLAAHWTGYSQDHQITGDEVHTILRNQPMLRHELSASMNTFRLDRWVRQ